MAKRKSKTMRRAARRVKRNVSKKTKRRTSGKTKGKKKRKKTEWQKHVAATYKVMKAKDPSIKGIGPVLKAASKTYKKRPLSMSVD